MKFITVHNSHVDLIKMPGVSCLLANIHQIYNVMNNDNTLLADLEEVHYQTFVPL